MKGFFVLCFKQFVVCSYMIKIIIHFSVYHSENNSIWWKSCIVMIWFCFIQESWLDKSLNGIWFKSMFKYAYKSKQGYLFVILHLFFRIFCTRYTYGIGKTFNYIQCIWTCTMVDVLIVCAMLVYISLSLSLYCVDEI